ncbi:MAG: YeeE/YedE thiosulfate transporter family protein [Candidatus Endonucleobacter bathymodioli]|uniref:YeeE/YedE thiosulfate transporter family protein n=1 Tax=Candidatus Endonucleibacter bathymodioli TaxID=539814 RepID=A0AA90NUG8_9GAMM|nr:YeeE/YedE thiosulfate transporter family protein [Candidatus Endonucleobacter bathymodioli]
MKNLFFQQQWNWIASGLALGIAFLLAVVLVKPIGISTQFVILDAIIWDSIYDNIIVEDTNSNSGYSSPNAYLNKSGGKYAKDAAEPLNYSFIFVLAMLLGGFIASKMQHGRDKGNDLVMPVVWKERFGGSTWKRHLASFVGGVLVLIGARLAGGCTSGHMMSGIMQTSVSGYLFAMGAFATAIPTAFLMYKYKGDKK